MNFKHALSEYNGTFLAFFSSGMLSKGTNVVKAGYSQLIIT